MSATVTTEHHHHCANPPPSPPLHQTLPWVFLRLSCYLSTRPLGIHLPFLPALPVAAPWLTAVATNTIRFTSSRVWVQTQVGWRRVWWGLGRMKSDLVASVFSMN